MLTCIARLPRIAALIYRNVFFDGKILPMENKSDMSENFCKMLGYNDPQFIELMRLYLTIHSDHDMDDYQLRHKMKVFQNPHPPIGKT